MAKRFYNIDEGKVNYAFNSISTNGRIYDSDIKPVIRYAVAFDKKGIFQDEKIVPVYERVVSKHNKMIAKQISDYEEKPVSPLNKAEKKEVAKRLNEHFKDLGYARSYS